MDVVQITLFGRLAIRRGGQPVELPAKAAELLCFLLLHRGRPQTREALATALWAEADAVQGKKYLRKALWQLQQALEGDGPGAAPLLQLDHDWVALQVGVLIGVDAYIFEDTCAALSGCAPQALAPDQVARAEQARAAYQDDLLPRWYQDWCLVERERHQSLYFALVDLLMDHYAGAGRLAEGTALGLGLLCHEPTRERTHRRLMRLAALAGDRGAALRQFDRCAAALARSFGIAPAAATLTLAAQIRAGALDAPPPVAEPHSLAILAAELERVRAYVAALQHELAALTQSLATPQQ
jgi:DNA-binding SARP family transcriptional activator